MLDLAALLKQTIDSCNKHAVRPFLTDPAPEGLISDEVLADLKAWQDRGGPDIKRFADVLNQGQARAWWVQWHWTEGVDKLGFHWRECVEQPWVPWWRGGCKDCEGVEDLIGAFRLMSPAMKVKFKRWFLSQELVVPKPWRLKDDVTGEFTAVAV
jgi:hypothetical protein